MTFKITNIIMWCLIIPATMLLYYLNITHFNGGLIKLEVLSTILDASGEALLRGSVEIPKRDIQWEAFVVDGKNVTYFGLFPSLIRIFLNAWFPEYRGLWGNLSTLLASYVALIFVYLSIRFQLRRNYNLSFSCKSILLLLVFLGIALSSPLFQITSNGTVYYEAIAWGLAFSITAIYFILRINANTMSKSIYAYLGFAVASALCLISRVTFAIPLLLLALLMLVKLFRVPVLLGNRSYTQILLFVLPIISALLLCAWCNYQRFGSIFEFADYSKFPAIKNPEVLRLDRFFYSLKTYFWPSKDIFIEQFPYIQLNPKISWASQYGHYQVERSLSLILTAPWLLTCSLLGYRALYKERLLAFAAAFFLIQIFLISIYLSITIRYTTEFFPFLVLGLYIFLRHFRLHNTYLISLFMIFLISLITIGGFLNIASTWEWASKEGFLVNEADRNKMQSIMNYFL